MLRIPPTLLIAFDFSIKAAFAYLSEMHFIGGLVPLLLQVFVSIEKQWLVQQVLHGCSTCTIGPSLPPVNLRIVLHCYPCPVAFSIYCIWSSLGEMQSVFSLFPTTSVS